MKAFVRHAGFGLLGAACLAPAYAQSVTAWQALHYAALHVWKCDTVQPYPGYEDGFVRTRLALRFSMKGEEPNLTGNYTEFLQQYGPGSVARSANYEFTAHVFDSPQDGTGIFIDHGKLTSVDQYLDRPLDWTQQIPPVRLQILPGENGDPYRISGTSGPAGAVSTYTCTAINAQVQYQGH